MAWLLLLGAIVCEVVGTIALKISDGMRHALPAVVVVCGYGCAFWLLSLTLRSLPIALVYAIWSGLGIVGTAVVGWRWFGESLDLRDTAGIGLILFGVLLLARRGG